MSSRVEEEVVEVRYLTPQSGIQHFLLQHPPLPQLKPSQPLASLSLGRPSIEGNATKIDVSHVSQQVLRGRVEAS